MNKLHTLQSLIEQMPKHGEQPALLDFQKDDHAYWSYATLAEHVQGMARGLIHAGLGRGDCVALLAHNQPSWMIACLAVIQAGAVVVPIDVQLDDAALSHVLQDSAVRYLCTTADQMARLDHLDVHKSWQCVLLDDRADDERSWHRYLTSTAAEIPQVEPQESVARF